MRPPCGYAIELALKYRICKLLRFRNGFPENRAEFTFYRTVSNSGILQNTITDVREIKNHDLNKLLFYSGKQLFIQNHFYTEWRIVESWSETLRYSASIVRANNARSFVAATRIIVAQLM